MVGPSLFLEIKTYIGRGRNGVHKLWRQRDRCSLTEDERFVRNRSRHTVGTPSEVEKDTLVKVLCLLLTLSQEKVYATSISEK